MNSQAQATIGGLSRGSTRAHIVRALFEGLAFRIKQALATLLEDTEASMPAHLRVDGGAAENDFLLQQLANAIGTTVERPESVQASVTGAAYLAGLGTGVWKDTGALESCRRLGPSFAPQWSDDQRESEYQQWLKAVTSGSGIA